MRCGSSARFARAPPQHAKTGAATAGYRDPITPTDGRHPWLGPGGRSAVVIVHGTAAGAASGGTLRRRCRRKAAGDPVDLRSRLVRPRPQARYDRISQAERLAPSFPPRTEPATVVAHSSAQGCNELALRHRNGFAAWCWSSRSVARSDGGPGGGEGDAGAAAGRAGHRRLAD